MRKMNRCVVFGLLALSSICHLHAMEVPERANNYQPVRVVIGAGLGVALGLAAAKIAGLPVLPTVWKGLFLGGLLSLVKSKEHALAAAGVSVLAGISALHFPHRATAAYWGAFSGFLGYHLFDMSRSALISRKIHSILHGPDFSRMTGEYQAHIRQGEHYDNNFTVRGSTLGKNWWVTYRATVQRNEVNPGVHFNDDITSSEHHHSDGAGNYEPAAQPNHGPIIEAVLANGGEQRPPVPQGPIVVQDQADDGDDW